MIAGAGMERSSLLASPISMVDPSPQETKAASDAINTFGLKLLAGETSRRQQKNVFLSPLSVFTALTMAENGAAGKTRDAIRRTLAVPSHVSEDALHESVSALLQSLNSQKSIELSIANALWSDTHWPLSPDFIEQCRKFYDANASVLDFSQPAAVDTINHWVSEKTKGKIPGIVTPSAVRASKAILTNAVYFKGRWSYQFNKDETKQGTFHLANDQSKQVDFMHRSSIEDGYRSGQGFEAAALPYENSEIKLYVILPAPGKSPEQALESLSVEKLRSSTEPNDLEIKLPKFTLDFEGTLKNVLEHMGMSIAFRDGAEFAPMGSHQFYIGDVLHKTRLEIDEEGTVAAASTAITMRASAAMRRNPEKKVLIFDRPFALLLCDTETGAILFAGVVYEP